MYHDFRSLQHISGLESNSKFFTVSFMGFLELTVNIFPKYCFHKDSYACFYENLDNTERYHVQFPIK